jgi:biotin-dependent carboxylase-like uncharacterized protein
MNPALHVLAPGLFTTVQDLGRPGHQHIGIPVCGALDPVSLQAANLLVGNLPNTGALEAAHIGPTLAVEADEVRLAIVGADAPIDVLDDPTAPSGRRIAPLRSFRAHRGQVVRIGALTRGAVLYIAVEGGFDIDPVLGSVATCIRGNLGGWHGRALVAADRLPLIRPQPGEDPDVMVNGLDLTPPNRFRAIPGPQADYFSENEIAAFFAGEYTVTAESNRMGMRLIGRPICHLRGFDIVSDGTAPGSIQIPGNGQPIVLMADRQTTGGYPKIATVISADLPALARLPIGTKVCFESTTVQAAEAARRAFVEGLASMKEKIVPLALDSFVPQLHECNLISGVVDAAA